MVIGANPTEGHPVFASQMKRRLRQGAKLIVADPRRIDLVRSPHVEAEHHLPLLPGTNVPLMNAFAHVVVTEDLVDHDFVRERCDLASFEEWTAFAAREENSPEHVADEIGVRPGISAPPRASMPMRATPPSTTAWVSPSTARVRPWSWRWRTWRWRPATSAGPVSASTRCGDRTTCRAPATWARFRTNCPAIGPSATTRCARSSRAPGASRSARSRDSAFRTC